MKFNGSPLGKKRSTPSRSISTVISILLSEACFFDHYEKIIVSLYPGLNASYKKIKSVNVVDWLIADEA